VAFLATRRWLAFYAAGWVVAVAPSVVYWMRNGIGGLYANEFNFFLNQLAWPEWLTRTALTDPDTMGHVLVLGGLAWIFAVLWGRAEQSPPARPGDGELRVWVAGVTAVAWAGMPWFSPDVCIYLSKGWMHAELGLNPYLHAINEIPGYEAHPLLSNVAPEYSGFKGNYGPLFHAVAYAAAWAGGGSYLMIHLIFKGVCALAHFGSTGWLASLARDPGERRRIWVYYGLNPLPLLVYVTCGHNDVLQVALLVGAIFLLFRQRPLASGVVMGMAFGIKYIFILLLPAFGLYFLRLGPRRCVADGLRWLLGGAGVAAGMFLVQPAAWALLVRNAVSEYECVRSSIYVFLLPLALVVARWMGHPEQVLEVLNGFRYLLIGAFFLIVGGYLAWRWLRRRNPDAEQELALGMFIILVAYVCLVTKVVAEWYLGWLLPAALLSGLAPLRKYVKVLSLFYLPPLIFILLKEERALAALAQMFLYLVLLLPVRRYLLPELWRHAGGGSVVARGRGLKPGADGPE
jgi:hypothetical protein